MANDAENGALALIDVLQAGLHAMTNESQHLYFNYLLSRNFDDINNAVICARIKLRVPPYSVKYMHLGRSLLRKYQHTRQAEDVTEAVKRLRRALQTFKDEARDEDNHVLHNTCLLYLSIAHLERDGNLDALRELNVPDQLQFILSEPSLETLTQVLNEGPIVSIYAKNKVSYYDRRYDSHGRMSDLDALIQSCRDARAYFASTPAESAFLGQLGSLLTDKFVKRRAHRDTNEAIINEAIECCCADLELQSPNSTVTSYWVAQCNASRSYRERFVTLGQPEDLEKAVSLAKQAVDVIERLYPNYVQDSKFAECLHCLSLALTEKYSATGDEECLDAAMQATSRAVDISESAKVDKQKVSLLLYDVLQLLAYRFQKSGRFEDLGASNVVAQRALSGWPRDHPKRVSVLTRLFDVELMQFMVYQARANLDRAVEHMEEACCMLAARPDIIRERVDTALYISLNNFLMLLSDKMVTFFLEAQKEEEKYVQHWTLYAGS